MRVLQNALLIVVALLCGPFASQAQDFGAIPPWDAQWVSHPDAPPQGPVVLHFRKVLALSEIPKTYEIQVSADNRFILYVNGQRVGSGPSQSDPQAWRYATFGISPYLKSGENVLAAEVWNFGDVRPMAQMTAETGFFVQGRTAREAEANTGKGWQVAMTSDHTASAVPMTIGDKWFGYYAAGPAERIDGRATTWNWQSGMGTWKDATPSRIANPLQNPTGPRHLTPDPLPPQIYRPVDSGKVVRSDLKGAKAFPLTIPANRRTRILIDRGTMIAGYPRLTVSGGRDAEIRLTYSEALYDKDLKKGDRNAIVGREALGLTDTFIADGGESRTFAPLWWRTWRYMALDITTGIAPLTLDRLEVMETGYPFEQKGWFRSDDSGLDAIWQAGWRTAKIDAHETYMDTAYWEQLQYVGDTRLQALISYVVSGDARLAEQAIASIGRSIGRDGLTQSRYPSARSQIIPSFSLLWIGMIHDYYYYNPDRSMPAAQLPGVRIVLDRFRKLRGRRGLLTQPPGWDWIDWSPGLNGRPANFYDGEGESCLTSLLFIGALQQAAELEGAVGDPARQARDINDATAAIEAVRRHCRADNGLIADAPDKLRYSQHANALAVLYDVVPGTEAKDVLQHIRPSTGLTAPQGVAQASYIWGHYIAQAEAKSGLANRYGDLMLTWRDMVKLNLTTLPEEAEPTRSDTHAWSAHPTSGLIEIVAGIRPASPGYTTVVIRPALGTLKQVDAAAAHPKGLIQARYVRSGGKLQAQLVLPDGVTGQFVWQGHAHPLQSGKTVLDLAD
ncbi:MULTISPECIES: family 78 glycoside hydrolase catalytic domain [Asticcacaulis]|uniref:family 78 glycoside hydrolase catalytic domain n=1 Tax=Asticcacaulis TaxID=76890 RepID=UPI001AEB1C9B|nr:MULTISPECIES: family 78 glycoside hydrolase catalytic domain [Asticcacaulis]MBP2158335.1 hypothetical protein [Asticcacaulis solisilvae]MDR6799380.1 hypothetical protein [Asticcacaulis sp. BE141]